MIDKIKQKPVIHQAVIYCRVSSVKQTTEGSGLSSQETRCNLHAKMLGLEVVRVFTDDVSGSIVDRQGVKELVAFLKKNNKTKFAVIIDDISRLARGVVQHHQLRDMITKAGGVLTSPSMEFSDDSDGMFRENLMASLAQHMRQKNGEQTVNRMMSRMVAGYWAFKAPIGYRMIKHAEHGKFLVPDEPLASVIREIYVGYATSRFGSLSEIMRFLDAHPSWPKSRKKTLSVERVSELLTRPHYAGYLNAPEWDIHMVKAKHEPLISFETYQRVQQRLTEKAKAPARKDISEDFPLRGFVRCECCGNYMTSCWSKGRNGKYPYYVCQTRDCELKGKSIRKEKMETEFEYILKSMRPSTELFSLASEIFTDLWDDKMKSRNLSKKSLEDEIEKTNRQIAQIVDRIVDTESLTLVSAYEKRIKELEIYRAETEEKVANCGRPLSSFDSMYRTALGFLENPYKLWENNNLATKRAVIKLTFASDIVYSKASGYRTENMAIPFKIFNNLVEKEGESSMRTEMVRIAGIEPARAYCPTDFKSGASTSSAISAIRHRKCFYWTKKSSA